jgi:hypothetical protein
LTGNVGSDFDGIRGVESGANPEFDLVGRGLCTESGDPLEEELAVFVGEFFLGVRRGHFAGGE